MKVLHIKFILLNFDSESDDFRLAKCLHCDKIVRRGKEGCSPRECTNSGMGSHMRSHHSGIAAQVLLFFEFTFCNLHCFQVQMQVQAAKATKVDTDLKDETVRGMMPLFKLRSKNDREQWRKMAFPVPETIQVGRREYHKYTVDSVIMATVILDSHLIIVGDAADAVSVNFSARCKFSRLNAKIYHFTECIQCTMCVIYANVSLL